MGWYTIPKPGQKNSQGEEIGPCIEPCKHTDCAASRKDAETICGLCGEPIGYDTPVYFGAERKHEHARCVWKKNTDESSASAYIPQMGGRD
jgi:hypothetical protein